MTIRVERAEGGSADHDGKIAKKIESAVKKGIMVSGTVEIVEYHSLPRTERKSKRLFDHRDEYI
jgi:phenylacetate-CoA ligase